MSATHAPALDAAALTRLAAAIADAADASAAFRAVAAAADAAIGHRLFTVMRFDADAMEVQRLYSSHPREYPPGGRKAKRDTAWGRRVLERGDPYIGRDAQDIRAHFDDADRILALDLASVLNVPVRVCGRTIGTMNLLHGPGHYDEAHLAPGALLAGLLAAPLLLAAPASIARR